MTVAHRFLGGLVALVLLVDLTVSRGAGAGGAITTASFAPRQSFCHATPMAQSTRNLDFRITPQATQFDDEMAPSTVPYRSSEVPPNHRH